RPVGEHHLCHAWRSFGAGRGVSRRSRVSTTERLQCSSLTVYSACSAQISWFTCAATGTWLRAYLADPSVDQPPAESVTRPDRSRDETPSRRVRPRPAVTGVPGGSRPGFSDRLMAGPVPDWLWDQRR